MEYSLKDFLLQNEAKFVHKLVYTCPELVEGLILGLGSNLIVSFFSIAIFNGISQQNIIIAVLIMVFLGSTLSMVLFRKQLPKNQVVKPDESI